MASSMNQQNQNDKPPIPPRPSDQYFPVPQTRYNHPYGSSAPFMSGPSAYFGLGGPHAPYGVSMVSGSNPSIDATFQSIQSLVQAFSSISMMLESTYMAVHSSFRAVMDVADHFIRLKDNLSGLMSVMAIYNTIKAFFKHILYMLNMVGEEQIWSDSLTRARDAIKRGKESIIEQGRSRSSSWPMLMFLGVAIGAPYMIYQIQKPPPPNNKWLTQEDCHYVGEALYDFETNQDSEIPLRAGQRVIIAPKEQQPRVTDWLLATTDGKRAGLIPMNYVKIVKFEIVE